MSELANNKSIRKEVNDLGETLGITPNGKTNQQKIRSIGEQASDGTYATKEYVNTLMSGALKRQIVVTLPVEDIDTNTIYMVLDQSASQQGNVYNEYLYINNAWELIGTTATSGAGIEYIQVNIGGGTLTAEQLAKVFDNGAVKEGVFFRIDNIILVSSGHPREQVFNSTVINGKYYSMEVNENTGVYTITEISVGGGIEFVDIEGKSGEFTQQEYTKLQNGAIIRKNGNELFFYAGAGDYLYYTATPNPNSTGDVLVVPSIEIDMTTLEWSFVGYEIAVIQP